MQIYKPLKRLLKDIRKFDLIVIDEAHKFRNYNETDEDSSYMVQTAKMLFQNIRGDIRQTAGDDYARFWIIFAYFADRLTALCRCYTSDTAGVYGYEIGVLSQFYQL